MKKVIIIVCSVLLVLGAVVVALVCFVAPLVKELFTDKPAITAVEFKESMEQRNFVVTDKTSQLPGYDYLVCAYVAESDDNGFKIEFYEISNVEDAIALYNHNKGIVEQSKGNVSSSGSKSGKNFAKYELTSNNKYMVVSRIDKTLIYLSVDQTYKNTVKEILTDLGY